MSVTEARSSDTKSQLIHQVNHINLNPESLDFDECLKDSPKFRHSLKENVIHIEHLESCMTRTIKQVSNYIETGREHIKSQRDFINSMKVLNQALGPNGNNTSKHVDMLLDTLDEITRLYEIVIDQSARTVGSNFSKFIEDDLLKLKDARKGFDKISHDYDQALIKHSLPVKKQHEDSENLLIATSTAFTHTSLDLSIQLTTLQSRKGYEILSSLLSFTRAYSTFFHQGFDLLDDLKPHISDMDEYLAGMQDECETLVRNLPSKHLMVSNNQLRPLCFDNAAEKVYLEGYLFKRASNGFKVWNRRWFILKDHQLMYQKRGEIQPSIMEEDLRLLTVRSVDKADTERRFCFEVVSPHKSHILQADSDLACKTWIDAIQAGISAAFHDTEHKYKPPIKNTTATDNVSPAGASSWSSSFSLKALQQQASSKLNSFAIGESKLASTTKDKTSRTNRQHKIDSISSGDEDDQDSTTCKTDDLGRSYVPLRDDDDELHREKQESSNHNDHNSPATYPAPAASLPTVQSSERGPPEKPQRAYMKILAMEGNDTCADCGASQPRWASINLGITLCIECAGIHRSLGVHLSKVRSLTLDTEVWSPEIVELMLTLGNLSVNNAYLACYRGQTAKIGPDCSREERENWIKSKYLLKLFMRPPGSDLDDSTSSDNFNDTADTVVEVYQTNELDQQAPALTAPTSAEDQTTRHEFKKHSSETSSQEKADGSHEINDGTSSVSQPSKNYKSATGHDERL